MEASGLDTTILIFLGVALAILALALFLSRVFARQIERDKQLDRAENGDLNAFPADQRGKATGIATWIGIRHHGDD